MERQYFSDNLVDIGYINLDMNNLCIENYDRYFDDVIDMLACNLDNPNVFKIIFKIKFTDGVELELLTGDFIVNLVFWSLPLVLDERISSSHLFFPDNISNNEIKSYIDKYIYKYKRKVPFVKMNNSIDAIFNYFIRLNIFELYLCNTLCLEDTIDLMNSNKDFYDTLHTDFSNVPLDQVKNVGNEITKKNIDIIKNSEDHSLKHPFLVREGINDKQYRNVAINIGTKPDGKGGVYPYIINQSFINGGLSNLVEAFMESNSGRIAQILTKCSIGLAGDFARLLGLNNMEAFINPNVGYACDTKNLMELYINDRNKLNLLGGRYYSLFPDGRDLKCIDIRYDSHLIGKTIYLRSPMTCASHSRGNGICFCCYGDLAYINVDLNVGKLAAEYTSSELTQRQLSAKHLLEVLAYALHWNDAFDRYFNVFVNFVALNQADFAGYKLLIDADAIIYDDDINSKDECYILSFDVVEPDGSIFTITSNEQQAIYLEEDLIKMIKSSTIVESEKDEDARLIELDMDKLPEHIMYTKVANTELTKTINDIKRTINYKDITTTLSKEALIDTMVTKTVDEGGLNIDIIHLEVILSMQIRDDGYTGAELNTPDWTVENPKYQILTLKSSLSNSPYITTSLLHQNISSLLTNPNIYDRYKASDLDLYFMTRPQEFLHGSKFEMEYYGDDVEKELKSVITFKDTI